MRAFSAWIVMATMTSATYTLVYAQSAKPDDPNAYGEQVNFGAREDHSLHPHPGNVVGGVRSGIAKSEQGFGETNQQWRGDVGSTPNPPGKN
jgi:hypothetical protein